MDYIPIISYRKSTNFPYSRGPLTGPTRTGPMLLKNKIIDILKIHVKPRDQFSRTHEIYLKKYT